MDPLDRLRRVVLISNSIPKSASTYLAALQRDFLTAIGGQGPAPLDPLAQAGVKHNRYFIPNPQDPGFVDLIASGSLRGPYVFKTHTPITGALARAFREHDHIQISTAIRDPVDIFLSARDNHRKTGEFKAFANMESGCKVIEGHFRRIYDSAQAEGQAKPLPILRYDRIVADPFGALTASLAPDLRDLVLECVAHARTDLARAQKNAANRMNQGALSRQDDPEAATLTARLAEMRRVMGYTP